MTPVTIIRHYKEKVSKCSLKHLHDKEGFTFVTGRPGYQFDATGYILLAVDAPPLSTKDGDHPLLLLDSTWRLLPQLEAGITGQPIRRSIPGGVKTAYPRVSKISEDPHGGLASIEALYLALKLQGYDHPELLDEYHWRDEFLAQF